MNFYKKIHHLRYGLININCLCVKAFCISFFHATLVFLCYGHIWLRKHVSNGSISLCVKTQRIVVILQLQSKFQWNRSIFSLFMRLCPYARLLWKSRFIKQLSDLLMRKGQFGHVPTICDSKAFDNCLIGIYRRH